MSTLSTINSEKYTVILSKSQQGTCVEVEGQVYLRSGIDKIVEELLAFKPYLPEDSSDD